MLFLSLVIPTLAWALLEQNVFTFPSSTWKQVTVARTNVSPKRPTEESWTSFQMSTSPIRSMQEDTLQSADSLESALMLQAHRWQRYYIRTLPRLKHLMFTSVLDWKRANTFSSLLTVKRILTPRKTFSRSSTLLILWQRNMICLSSTVATHVRAIALQLRASSLTHVYRYSNLLASMTTTASRWTPLL